MDDSLTFKRHADDLYYAEFPPLAIGQLEEELLKGVRSPHRPFEPGEFSRLAKRLIAESARDESAQPEA